MPQGMRWVALDLHAHAHASAVAVFDDVTRRVNGRPLEVLGVLRELPGPVRAVYEAKPAVRERLSRTTKARLVEVCGRDVR